MRLRTFSIRSLLIVTLVFAVCLAVLLRRAENQKRGREWVLAQRGHVYYAHDIDDNPLDTVPHVPERLVRLMGVDFFSPIRTVIFDCDELSGLEPITTMPGLHTIVINIEMADSIDLSPMEELPNLREVHFSKWSFVSKEQLAELRRQRPDVTFISETHDNGG